MSKENLYELEHNLHDTVEQHSKLGDAILKSINERNTMRGAMQEATFWKVKQQTKIKSFIIFAACAVVAFILYKTIFGMF